MLLSASSAAWWPPLARARASAFFCLSISLAVASEQIVWAWRASAARWRAAVRGADERRRLRGLQARLELQTHGLAAENWHRVLLGLAARQRHHHARDVGKRPRRSEEAVLELEGVARVGRGVEAGLVAADRHLPGRLLHHSRARSRAGPPAVLRPCRASCSGTRRGSGPSAASLPSTASGRRTSKDAVLADLGDAQEREGPRRGRQARRRHRARRRGDDLAGRGAGRRRGRAVRLRHLGDGENVAHLDESRSTGPSCPARSVIFASSFGPASTVPARPKSRSSMSPAVRPTSSGARRLCLRTTGEASPEKPSCCRDSRR